MEIESMPIPDDLLKKLTAASNHQIELEKKLDELEAEQSRLNQELAQVAGGWDGHEQILIEGQIPSLMAEAGVLELVLTGGMKIEVNKELKIPSMDKEHSENREKIVNWAESAGHGKIIKDVVIIPFDKGDLRVKAVLALLSTLALAFERFRSLNHNTLKALFREILEDPKEGEPPLPLNELGVQQYQKSKISFPKLKVKK